MSFSPLGNMALPFARRGAGRRDEFGSHVPPGARVAAYVHHSGAARVDDLLQSVPVVTDMRDAVNACRPGYGDVVYVLPGHAQNVDSADWFGTKMKAGAKIIGLGEGNLRPTLTWTAAASTLLLDEANVRLSNLRLLMDPGAGTVNVAAPLTISGPGCALDSCQIRMGTDANSKVTIGITTTAAADDLLLQDLDIYGATAAECTTMMQFVGADRLRLIGCSVVGATSAVAVGVIRFLTTASTFIKILGCTVRNNKALSEQAITGMAGISGEADHLHLCTLDGVAPATSTAFSTLASMQLGLHVYATTLAGERANNYGTVSA